MLYSCEAVVSVLKEPGYKVCRCESEQDELNNYRIAWHPALSMIGVYRGGRAPTSHGNNRFWRGCLQAREESSDAEESGGGREAQGTGGEGEGRAEICPQGVQVRPHQPATLLATHG